jgi:ankyrin repeat protein/L-ascorbate metabolism protein UlaG (beta-lactamase superfamily)
MKGNGRKNMIKKTIIFLIGTGLSPVFFGYTGSEYAQDIHCVVAQGDLVNVKRMIENIPELIHQKDKESGATPLHVAAASGHLEIARFLLSKGASADAKNNRGETPFLLAIVNGRKEMTHFLIKEGIDIYGKSGDGGTYLQAACATSQIEIVEYLLSCGFDPNLPDMYNVPHIFMPIYLNNPEIAKIFIKYGADTGAVRFDGVSVAEAAIEFGETEILDLLVKDHSDLKRKNPRSGRTLLHIAAVRGQKDIVELFLKRGAEIDAVDRLNKTPLDYAERFGHDDVVESLITHGALIRKKAPLEVTYVANEGFMISSAGKKILIDALFGNNGLPGEPSREIMDAINSSKKPFEQVSLILTTHGDGDHFSLNLVGDYLREHHEVVMIAPEKTGQDMGLFYPEFSQIQKQVLALSPDWKDSTNAIVNGIGLKILGIQHSARPGYNRSHSVYLIELNGYKILHLGDSAPLAEEYELFTWLAEERIHVAFIPYWFLTDTGGETIIREIIRPKHIVAMHFHPDQFEHLYSQIKKRCPGAVIFKNSMDRRVFKVQD